MANQSKPPKNGNQASGGDRMPQTRPPAQQEPLRAKTPAEQQAELDREMKLQWRAPGVTAALPPVTSHVIPPAKKKRMAAELAGGQAEGKPEGKAGRKQPDQPQSQQSPAPERRRGRPPRQQQAAAAQVPGQQSILPPAEHQDGNKAGPAPASGGARKRTLRPGGANVKTSLPQKSGAPSVSASIQIVGRKRPSISQATAHPARGTLRMIPLGGMCEIGKNMTVYEYGEDIIIVDCGQSFPDETMPGVDAVIPDFTYVLQNRDRVRGVFLTHGHEDHIGAMSWLMQEIRCPVYGGRMTIELVKYRLEDRVPGLAKSCDLRVVQDGQSIRGGCFSVEFIHVNHSIVDASMLAIRTPAGYVMHSGDFKIDYTPIDGGIMDLQRVAEIGREGVLLFVCESTNIEVKGHSVSERHVGESFANMFAASHGRIFVATFSSNSYRLQQIFTAAEKLGRKVALVGRSMLNVFNAANSLGYIQMRADTLIDINQIDNYRPEQVVIISTGSQGEPMSALTRIAFSSHREVEIMRGDTVIISASPIPGNEKPVYKVINELYKRGAKVYYSALADVHASGHASRDELRLVQTLIKPRFLIPHHGEYRMMYQQAELAHELGMAWEDIFLLSNGDIFEIARGKARVAGFTNGAAVLIDGAAVGDVDNPVLRERKILSDDGVVAVSVVLGRKTGELAAPPVASAMGFLYDSEYEQVISECERRTVAFVLRMKNQNRNVAEGVRSGLMRDQIRTFLFEKTRRRPVVMVLLSEL